MLKTDEWVCDACGEPIKKPADGWVEWVEVEDPESGRFVGRDLRLVHHLPASPRGPYRGCQFDKRKENARNGGSLSGFALPDFLGPDGLMRLLLMAHDGAVPLEQIIEMVKRLHIPGYERARPFFRDAIRDGVFERNMPEGFYWQVDIQATLKYADGRE